MGKVFYVKVPEGWVGWATIHGRIQVSGSQWSAWCGGNSSTIFAGLEHRGNHKAGLEQSEVRQSMPGIGSGKV